MMLYSPLIFISGAPAVTQAAIDLLAIPSLLKNLLDYVRAWMPDALEGKWIPVIAVGMGITFCFAAGLPIVQAVMQGLMYGLVAAGIASSTTATQDAKKNGNGQATPSKG